MISVPLTSSPLDFWETVFIQGISVLSLVAHNRKLAGFNQHAFTIRQFWRSEVHGGLSLAEIVVCPELVLSGDSRGESISLPFQHLEAATFLDPWSPSLCLQNQQWQLESFSHSRLSRLLILLGKASGIPLGLPRYTRKITSPRDPYLYRKMHRP